MPSPRYDDRRRNKEKAKAGIWCSYIASYDHETSSITFPFPYLDLFPIRPIYRSYTTIFLPSRTVHLHFFDEMKATYNRYQLYTPIILSNSILVIKNLQLLHITTKLIFSRWLKDYKVILTLRLLRERICCCLRWNENFS